MRDQRIAQDVVAFALPLVAGHSIFAGWVTARPESDAATVERAYLEELDRMASEPVTDDELARAKALIESAELGAVSRMEEVADRLSMYATYFDDPERINDQLGRYLAVDAAQIQSVAASVFRADNRAVVTYVPAAGNGAGGDDDDTGSADDGTGRTRHDRARGSRTEDVTLPAETVREFSTDAGPIADVEPQPAREDGFEREPTLGYLDVRPSAAAPREYHFPHFERRTLANGLELVTANVPGRAAAHGAAADPW